MNQEIKRNPEPESSGCCLFSYCVVSTTKIKMHSREHKSHPHLKHVQSTEILTGEQTAPRNWLTTSTV